MKLLHVGAMQRDARPTRRQLLGWAGGILAGPMLASHLRAASSDKHEFEVETVARRYSSAVASTVARHYRVHAAVSLLGVPLISKQDVGGAVIQVEEWSDGDATTVALQFCGGSWPGRLRGFNRFGMSKEAVHLESGKLRESAYLGFMTSSPEKNMGQARQAFLEPAAAVSFSASHGRSTPGECSGAVARMTVPGRFTWFDCEQIVDALRESLSPASLHKASGTCDAALPTFLFAIRSAPLSSEPRKTTFMHAGKIYGLRTRFSDHKNGQRLMNGAISEQDGGTASQFRLLFDPDAADALPISIEFKPRSFLTLRFEQTEPQPVPAIRPLLREVSA